MKKAAPKIVDRLVPETWVKYRPSLCRGCTAGCCTLPVQVTSEELYHMGFLELHQVNGPLKRIASRLKKQGIIKSFRVKTRIFTLQTKNGTDCIFLDEKRLCKIYDRRPSICRIFPANSARPGYCPSERQGQCSSKKTLS